MLTMAAIAHASHRKYRIVPELVHQARWAIDMSTIEFDDCIVGLIGATDWANWDLLLDVDEMLLHKKVSGGCAASRFHLEAVFFSKGVPTSHRGVVKAQNVEIVVASFPETAKIYEERFNHLFHALTPLIRAPHPDCGCGPIKLYGDTAAFGDRYQGFPGWDLVKAIILVSPSAAVH